MPRVNIRSVLADAATGALAIAAVVAVGFRVHDALRAHDPQSYAHIEQLPDWQRFAVGRAVGPETAPVTVIEFTDFQCPYCRKAATELARIRSRYPGAVRVVYRHFPLSIHEHAKAAAIAAECAGEAGRFEAFHNHLFEQQDSIGAKSFTRFASDVGVADTAAFARCAADTTGGARWIARDRAVVRELGLDATPTFIVNGLMFSGFPGRGALLEQVERAMAAQPPRRVVTK